MAPAKQLPQKIVRPGRNGSIKREENSKKNDDSLILIEPCIPTIEIFDDDEDILEIMVIKASPHPQTFLKENKKRVAKPPVVANMRKKFKTAVAATPARPLPQAAGNSGVASSNNRRIFPPNGFNQNIRYNGLSAQIVDLSHPQGRIEHPKEQRMVIKALRWHFEQLQFQHANPDSIYWSTTWRNGYLRVDCGNIDSVLHLLYVISIIPGTLWSGCLLYAVPTGSINDNVFNGQRCIVLYTNYRFPGTPEDFLHLMLSQNRHLPNGNWTALHWTCMHWKFGPMYCFLVDCSTYRELIALNGCVNFGDAQLCFNLQPHADPHPTSLTYQLISACNYVF